ncbi:MAG: hypothetical protein LC116_04310 [Bacteroidetes bacterium]|nr:hypothetical protein [Bacteroidota bacterium]MCZ2132404.1 hypothetical protein [Bacteroidota bacterium]
MKRFLYSFAVSVACCAAALMFQSCPAVTNALANMQRLQFKLDGLSNFRLAGVSFAGKSSITDFSAFDALSLTRAFGTNQFPAEFILNVAAANPNDGKGGARQSSALLQGLEWRLLIDDKQTVSGDIDAPVEIPGTGQTTIIPVRISLDLYKFFGSKGYDNVINLALALGGAKGSTSRLKLDARPTISTPIGPLTYPNRITIIDKQFSN